MQRQSVVRLIGGLLGLAAAGAAAFGPATPAATPGAASEGPRTGR